MQRRVKTFKGCFRCRARKVKCDESRPHCNRCIRVRKSCPGYSIALVWVTPNHETSKVQGRGGLCPDSTWRGWPILTTDELDRILLELDERGPLARLCFNPARSFFSILDDLSVRQELSTPSNSMEPRTPGKLNTFESGWDNTSRYLFHHYVNQVALQMMPFGASSNPWRTHYPHIALNNDCIRHALLSQAAGHVFHLEGRISDMEIIALKHREAALAQLRILLSTKTSSSFEIKLAAILSLIMADVYLGISEGWRSHVFGAVEIALNNVAESPWSVSEMAWLTAQSLCLLYLRTKVDGNLRETESSKPYDEPEFVPALLAPVSHRPEYGFTIGASQSLASCLGDCAAAISKTNAQSSKTLSPLEVEMLSHRLLSMTLDSSSIVVAANQDGLASQSQLDILHTHIFALGLLICLRRRTLNPSPSELRIYSTLLFQGVAAFRALADANAKRGQRCCGPTMWPVFHGAIELYRPEDQQYAREVWLDEIETFAIGNRKHVRSVLERVWLVRNERAQLLSKASSEQLDVVISRSDAAGSIKIDWTEVAEEMGLDVLLV